MASEGGEANAGGLAAWQKQLEAYLERLELQSYRVEEAYDRAVLTLSGGALGLSFAFLKDVAPHPEPSTMWVLAVAWLALVVSIVLILVSMLTSQRAFSEALDIVHAQLAAAGGGAISPQTASPESVRRTIRLNLGAAGCLIVGLAGLSTFGIVNVTRRPYLESESGPMRNSDSRPDDRPVAARGGERNGRGDVSDVARGRSRDLHRVGDGAGFNDRSVLEGRDSQAAGVPAAPAGATTSATGEVGMGAAPSDDNREGAMAIKKEGGVYPKPPPPPPSAPKPK